MKRLANSVLTRFRGWLVMTCLLFTNLLGNEIWIAPAKRAANREVGDWAVTLAGDTHFSFGVPDNLTSFVGAKLLLIGRRDGDFTYDLSLSVAQNGQRHDCFH